MSPSIPLFFEVKNLSLFLVVTFSSTSGGGGGQCMLYSVALNCKRDIVLGLHKAGVGMIWDFALALFDEGILFAGMVP